MNLNPGHVDHFLHTADLSGPFFLDSYSMSPRSFKETKVGNDQPSIGQLGFGGAARMTA